MARPAHVHYVLIAVAAAVTGVELHGEVLYQHAAHVRHQRYVVRAPFRVPEHRVVPCLVVVGPWAVVHAQHLQAQLAVQLLRVGQRYRHALLRADVLLPVEVGAHLEIRAYHLVAYLRVYADGERLFQVFVHAAAAVIKALVRLPRESVHAASLCLVFHQHLVADGQHAPQHVHLLHRVLAVRGLVLVFLRAVAGVG